jgi:hypothetical protein
MSRLVATRPGERSKTVWMSTYLFRSALPSLERANLGRVKRAGERGRSEGSRGEKV